MGCCPLVSWQNKWSGSSDLRWRKITNVLPTSPPKRHLGNVIAWNGGWIPICLFCSASYVFLKHLIRGEVFHCAYFCTIKNRTGFKWYSKISCHWSESININLMFRHNRCIKNCLEKDYFVTLVSAVPKFEAEILWKCFHFCPKWYLKFIMLKSTYPLKMGKTLYTNLHFFFYKIYTFEEIYLI